MSDILRIKVPSSDGVHMLAGVVYLPEGTPRGLFQMVHGMTEYIDRYDGLLRLMATRGYIAFGHDHLGHGHTVRDAGELGFIAHKDGWRRLCEDVALVCDAVRTSYQPEGETLPWILAGHSMGSFVVRLTAAHVCRPDGLIVLGTGGPNPAAGIGICLARLVKAFCGERHISPLLYTLAFGSYNKRFKQEMDPVAWLTTDKAVRDRYRADPLCTFRFTTGAMEDLIRLNRESNRFSCARSLSDGLPILLISGRDDPVGAYGQGVTKVYNSLKRQGADVRMILYDGYRHELLNDTCREDILRDILAFTGNAEE